MRDTYIDFGTFTVRVIEEDDTIVAEDVFTPEDTTPPAPFDYAAHVEPSVEVIDAADFGPNDEQRTTILRQELQARLANVEARLHAGNGRPRNCHTEMSSAYCNEPYYYDGERFVHNGSLCLFHNVKPNSDDAELLIIRASLLDMIGDA